MSPATEISTQSGPLRIAIVYDCLFPGASGGAERWLWALAVELSEQGHHVTYVTRDFGVELGTSPVSVKYLSNADALYDESGVRRIGPSLSWARRVGWFLRRNRADFDAFYLHQTPLWPLLAAKVALLGTKTWWGVEWIEWWPRAYWQHYTPGITGAVGWQVQRLALRIAPRIFTYASVTDVRVRAQHPRGQVHRMPGQVYRLGQSVDIDRADGALPDGPFVLTLGRLVPEKHPEAAVLAMAEVCQRHPGVAGVVIGRGPLEAHLKQIARTSEEDIRVISDADDSLVMRALSEASGLLHPSAREGFGLVVIEAAAHGTPTVVVAGDDNAAVELVTAGVNGEVAQQRDPQSLADAVDRLFKDPEGYRARTLEWYGRVTQERSVTASAKALTEVINRDLCRRSSNSI